MFDFLLALCNMTNDYHSGQASKGYHLLCLTQQYLEKWYNIERPLDLPMSPRASVFYLSLSQKYEREM